MKTLVIFFVCAGLSVAMGAVVCGVLMWKSKPKRTVRLVALFFTADHC